MDTQKRCSRVSCSTASLMLKSSRSQLLCALPSWDVAARPSAPWSQGAAEAGGGAAAQPWPEHGRLLVSALPNAGGPKHPWRWSSSCGPSLLHNGAGKLYNTSYIIWLGRSERTVATHGWLLLSLTRLAYVVELLSIGVQKQTYIYAGFSCHG